MSQVPPEEAALAYHRGSKHHPHRYAPSLGYLDWATQPDPFRRHEGARRVLLPFRSDAPALAWDAPPPAPQPLALETLGDLLRHALGLSAWKRHGPSRWALRVNPSSGNLHPVEGHVVLPPLRGVADGPVVAHHAPEDHALEIRAELPAGAWALLAAGLPAGSFLVGLSSITWREAWKYGERALRYCQHDTGHALAALALAASFLGWRLTRLPNWSSDDIAELLGTARPGEGRPDEPEEAQLLAAVHPADSVALPHARAAVRAALEAARAARWHGRPNALSQDHVADWPAADAAAASTRHDGRLPVREARLPVDLHPAALAPPRTEDARRLALRRRSAVAMDGRTAMDRASFERILARLLPLARAPWTALSHAPAVHLFLFVHRVEGLAPGLCALVRDAEALPRLRAATHPDFEWEPPPGTPAGLPLYRLAEGDARNAARLVSCHQDIAADGAFSFGMVAELRAVVEREGASAWRELYWEAGVIGQVAYLETEAAGLSATGIGCYFDDVMHRLLGIVDDRFQSLYHFTVGGALVDRRLQTEPGYPREAGSPR